MQSEGERALWVSLTDAFNAPEGRTGFSCTWFCQNHPEKKKIAPKQASERRLLTRHYRCGLFNSNESAVFFYVFCAAAVCCTHENIKWGWCWFYLSLPPLNSLPSFLVTHRFLSHWELHDKLPEIGRLVSTMRHFRVDVRHSIPQANIYSNVLQRAQRAWSEKGLLIHERVQIW